MEEDLRGTAPRADGWLLIEHPGPWGPAGFADSGLPGHVVAELEARAAAVGVRIQLIRRHAVRHDVACSTVFLARSRPDGTWLRRFEVPDHDRLLDLPVEACMSTEPPDDGEGHGRLHLVCTHGRRDACCAEFGRGLAARLAATRDIDVYETTHTGGHRFAANVVVLPEGLTYGRVTAEDLDRLVVADREDRVLSDRLRGRSCFDVWEQAADVHVRDFLGLDRIDAVAIDGSDAGDDGTVTVTLSAGGHTYRVVMERRETGAPRAFSCGDETARDPGVIEAVAFLRG